MSDTQEEQLSAELKKLIETVILKQAKLNAMRGKRYGPVTVTLGGKKEITFTLDLIGNMFSFPLGKDFEKKR